MYYTNSFFRIFTLLFKPFTNRIKLGEGGLVILNFAHSVASQKSYMMISLETSVSFLVLCALYGYNDFSDAEKDKLNPKKDAAFIELILANQKLFLGLIIAIQLITISFAYIFLGWHIALCLIALYATNFLYSQKVKEIPLADIVIVSLWGGLYICLAGYFQWKIAAAAGLMTGIAHFFQVITDKESDQKNNIKTSAVALIGWENVLLFALCCILGYIVFSITSNWIIAAIGLFPFLFYFLSKLANFSWYAARFIFFILWIIILKTTYAVI